MRSTFDFGAALTYMFESADWVRKYLIALVVSVGSLFIVPIFLYQGYTVEIIRRVMRGDAEPLPEWEGRWSDYLGQGFTATVGVAIYSLPLAFFCACALVPYVLSIDIETGEPNPAMMLLACVGFVVYLVASIAIGYVAQAGLVRYARGGRLADFFDLRGVFALARSRVYLKGFFTSYLAILVAAFVPLVAMPWATFASGHALGQAGRAHFGGAPPSEASATPRQPEF